VSWDDTLERATRLATEVRFLLDVNYLEMVLHEMPPVGTGPYVRRSESSVVAATVIRVESARSGIPVAHVSAQKAKKHLTGDSRADKKDVREAIEKRIANGQLTTLATLTRWNSHIYDAIALALTFREAK
jgi:Holliday junction resolvasome RuvABC endonuclease subunit